MKRGEYHQYTNAGFTIIEVLIVLAVTASLFILAVVYVGGKQSKTEFQVGSRQIQQQFQQVISDVQNGYYPSNAELQCAVSAQGVSLRKVANTSQGSNDACIFVGKTIVIGGNNNAEYMVYSLAGRRLNTSGQEVSNVQEARPVAITPINTDIDAPPDLTVKTPIPNALTFVWGSIDGGITKINSSEGYLNVSIMTNFSQFANAGIGDTGLQSFSLRGMDSAPWGTALGNNTTPMQQATLINDEVTRPNPYPALQSAQYCFASGGTDQSVLVTINSGLQVSSEIKSGKSC